MRQCRADRFHAFDKPGHVIGTIHRLEQCIVRRLYRNVQMAGNARFFLHVGNEIIINLIHLDAGDAIAYMRRRVVYQQL